MKFWERGAKDVTGKNTIKFFDVAIDNAKSCQYLAVACDVFIS